MYVEEKNRSWCSSSNANDQRAITIECASDTTEPYAFRDIVYKTLIKLCVDICKRNGKNKLLWFGDKDKTLNYTPKSGEMILTQTKAVPATGCMPGWAILRRRSRHSSVVVPMVKVVPQLHREHKLLPLPGNPSRML